MKTAKPQCKWIFGKRKCKNDRYRDHLEYCENHLQLEEQIEGFRRARSALLSAGVLVDYANTKTRDSIFSDFVTGCESWQTDLFGVANRLDLQIKSMDKAWAAALPKLERKSMRKPWGSE